MEWNGAFSLPVPVPFLVDGKVYAARTIVKEIWEIVYNIEDQDTAGLYHFG